MLLNLLDYAAYYQRGLPFSLLLLHLSVLHLVNSHSLCWNTSSLISYFGLFHLRSLGSIHREGF